MRLDIVEIETFGSGLGELIELLSRADSLLSPPLSSRVRLEDYARKLADHGIVLTANVDEQRAGVLGLYANDQENKAAYLSLMAVFPEFQGNGIGSRLLDWAMGLAMAKGMRRMILEVSAENRQARSLYEKMNFRETGQPPAVGGRTNSIFMERALEDEAG